MYNPSVLSVPPVSKPHRGLAIAALVLGIVGTIFGFIPITFIVAFICGTLALIFGLIARRHGMGKAGIILGVCAIAFGIWGAIIVTRVTNDINNQFDCIGKATTVHQMDKCN